MTFYMYLNTPEEGGGTRFPQLNFTVEAKEGHAVMWPGIHANGTDDLRTEHEGQTVLKGLKYDFKVIQIRRDVMDPCI